MAHSAVRAVVRTVKTPRVALSLTRRALDKVTSHLSENPGAIGLRVGVRTRGCNGLSYTMEYASEKGKLDEEVVQDGVRIFIDRKAQLTLLGTEMDYEETRVGQGFVFNNPNIKGTCGCGESFHV